MWSLFEPIASLRILVFLHKRNMLFQRHLDMLSSYRFLLTEFPFRHFTIISLTIWCIRKCSHSHILGGAVYSKPLFSKYSLFHSMRFWDASEVTTTLSPNLRFTICLILGDLCRVALLLFTSFATISVHLSKESFVDTLLLYMLLYMLVALLYLPYSLDVCRHWATYGFINIEKEGRRKEQVLMYYEMHWGIATDNIMSFKGE